MNGTSTVGSAKQHEWEQIDQGEAYCVNCKTDDPNTECKKTSESKAPERDIVPKEVEKEKIKRQLYNLIDRVDKL